MIDDDDDGESPTPVSVRQRRVQTSESRDLAAAKRRRARPKSYPQGVPANSREEDEITSPIDLLGRDLDDDDRANLLRLRSESIDPIELLYKLSKAMTLLKERSRSKEEANAREIRELLDRPPRDVVNRFEIELRELRAQTMENATGHADIKQFVDSQRKIVNWIGGGLISAIIAIGGFLYFRGVSEGSNGVRMEQFERAIRRLEDQADSARRREYSFPPFPTQKGTEP